MKRSLDSTLAPMREIFAELLLDPLYWATWTAAGRARRGALD